MCMHTDNFQEYLRHDYKTANEWLFSYNLNLKSTQKSFQNLCAQVYDSDQKSKSSEHEIAKFEFTLKRCGGGGGILMMR